MACGRIVGLTQYHNWSIEKAINLACDGNPLVFEVDALTGYEKRVLRNLTDRTYAGPTYKVFRFDKGYIRVNESP